MATSGTTLQHLVFPLLKLVYILSLNGIITILKLVNGITFKISIFFKIINDTLQLIATISKKYNTFVTFAKCFASFYCVLYF